MTWLPSRKKAAVCFSIDDVHPATLSDPYEAGGSLGDGALRFVERLLDRHPLLRITLFVTPDWRPIQLVTTRRLARLPLLSRCLYHVDLHPKNHFRIDRRVDFVRYVNELPRTEVAMHGLHHVHRGPDLAVEFQGQSYRRCKEILRTGRRIFERAGLVGVRGFGPPGWNVPLALLAALEDTGFSFVSSARDIRTPIALDAENAMSGLLGVSILRPQLVGTARKLVHIPTNFQATSPPERAREIIDCGGLVSVKAHIFKHGGGYTMVDGLDESYFRYVDRLFLDLEDRYGDALWWASMDEIAHRLSAATNRDDSGQAA